MIHFGLQLYIKYFQIVKKEELWIQKKVVNLKSKGKRLTKLISGPILGKPGPLHPSQEIAHHEQHENVVSLVSRHAGIGKIGGFAQKNDFGPKTALLGPKGPLWATGAEKRPAKRPNSNLPDNRRYPELPQDMGNL